MTPRSLRTTLALSYAGVLALLLTALGVAYYHAFARQLDIDATAALREITSGVHGYLRFQAGVPILMYDRNDPEQVTFVQEATAFYQVYDANTGRLLVQSPALEPLGMHYTPNEVRALLEQPAVYDVQTDRRRLRISNSVISPAPGEKYLLQVGVALDQRNDALLKFLRLLVWSLPGGLLAVIVIGQAMAARALAPFARLAAATRTIGVDDLHRRLPVRGAGDELDAVADAFNNVVTRLERSVGEMKQFSAAMAHELRSPLAAIRGEIEFALAHPRSPAEYQRGLVSQLEEIDKLARLISQLLTLARAEAGEIPLAPEAVDLAALSMSVVETLEPVAQAKDLALVCAVSGEVLVTGDSGWMRRLVLNLLDNAIKFTPPGGRISVSVARESETARLEVSDTGIGMTSETLPHLFERFYRADSARSPQTAGAGLGLSLVKWIADRHGAHIDVNSRPGEGSTFALHVPLGTSRTTASRHS